ncbi:hypothetical protein BDZ97DRAFT_1617781, partial [Flammula alnicola]
PLGRFIPATMALQFAGPLSGSGFDTSSLRSLSTTPSTETSVTFSFPPTPFIASPIIPDTPLPNTDIEMTSQLPGISPFHGDGEKDENPQDFLKTLKQLFLSSTIWDDSRRVEFFASCLKSSSVAEEWYDNLPPTATDTWAHLEAAFKSKWPVKTKPGKTKAEKQQQLEDCVLKEEELGTTKAVDGTEEQAHIVWADKVQRLAAAIPDTDGLLIGAVRRNLPAALKALVGDQHATWRSFCDAVHAIPLSLIREQQEAEKEKKEFRKMKEEMERLKRLQDTPSKAKVHPDTPAGQAMYQTDVTTWRSAHGSLSPNETRPYPLSPGTSPVASGECWKCGHHGHMATNCSSTKQVPPSEERWRAIAAGIKRRATADSTAQVNLVVNEEAWVSEEMRQQIIQEYLEQGKAQGTEPPVYLPVVNTTIVDLYIVGSESKRSVPFVHGIELKGPQGEIMADGRLVPSHGIWHGEVSVRGIAHVGTFEIFDSRGAWAVLFGKPLLQTFRMVHDYGVDEIMIPM